ncbi:hypothetical protein [Dactylosporangium sp. CA-233914]|uniref:hypothetical protein n=1 Tax=Dactylosporangium sp. CA-233914 TaxID=3239934 RepID=UPI003D949E63
MTDVEIRWLASWFDAGDREPAARALLRRLAGGVGEAFVTEGPRILAVLPPEERIGPILDSPQLYSRWWSTSGQYPPDHVAAAFAACVAGHPEPEEALLRAVMAPTDHERRYPGHLNRRERVSGAIAACSAAYPASDTAQLDRWAAILGSSEFGDRPRLAAAATQLAPLGLAEIDARCGTVDDFDGPALAGALSRAGRLDDALTLTTRLDPRRRQAALMRIETTDGDRLLTAWRKCPKTGRTRDEQQMWRHRLGTLQLRFGKVDDALRSLAGMRDCRVSGYGPAYLTREIARHLAAHPDQATDARLREILGALTGEAIIPQELATVITEVLIHVYRLGDPLLRKTLNETYADTFRTRLRWYDQQLVTAAPAVAGEDGHDLAALVGTKNSGWMARSPIMVEAIEAAALPTTHPEECTRTAVASLADRATSTGATRLLPPATHSHLEKALAALPPEARDRTAEHLAAAAAEAGDEPLMAIARAAAPTEATARHEAILLARTGNLTAAGQVAKTCGLPN